jgi:rubrerythrin
MSKIPGEIDKKNEEKQILRVGIIAELDAVSLYEQLAARAKTKK